MMSEVSAEVPRTDIDQEAALRFGAIMLRNLPGSDMSVLDQFSHAAPDLTHEQQDTQAESMAEGNRAEARLRNLSDPTAYQDVKISVAAGEDARKLLFWALYPHVLAGAKVVLRRTGHNPRIELSDLAQAGAEKMLGAIDRYANLEPEARLSLVNYVLASVRRAFSAEVDRSLKLFPNTDCALPYNAFVKASLKLRQKLGRDPEPNEVAALIDISLEDAEALARLMGDALWVDPTLIGAINDSSLKEAVIQPDSKTSKKAARLAEIYLEFLSPLHARAIRLKFGMDEYGYLSVSERAGMLGISETSTSTTTREAIGRLTDVARALNDGTLDYEDMRIRYKIRNAFSIFHFMGITPDLDKGTSVLRQEAEQLLRIVTESDLEREVMRQLYRLDPTHAPLSTAEVGERLGKSAAVIRNNEKKVLIRMDEYAAARATSLAAFATPPL